MDIKRLVLSEYMIILSIAMITIVSISLSITSPDQYTNREKTNGNGPISESSNSNETAVADTNYDSSRSSREAFAIFTLPYDDNNNGKGDLYSSSDYVQAMEIIESHMDSSSGTIAKSYNGHQGDSLQNYIIQSIRVIAKNNSAGGENDIPSQAGSAPIQDQQPFDILANSNKMITVQSLDNITSAMQYGQQYRKITHILYDIEHWSRTPLKEQQNPIQSISEASNRIHKSSLKYGITPDAPFLLENYKKINWTQVDFLGMQLQRFSQNFTEFTTHVREISTYVKAENPSTQIFVQLSFRFADADQMIAAIEAARPWVDGYIIAYLPHTPECHPNCSPDALDLVLSTIVDQKNE